MEILSIANPFKIRIPINSYGQFLVHHMDDMVCRNVKQIGHICWNAFYWTTLKVFWIRIHSQKQFLFSIFCKPSSIICLETNLLILWISYSSINWISCDQLNASEHKTHNITVYRWPVKVKRANLANVIYFNFRHLNRSV